MAKWINTTTGLVVPESEVREAVPGSGIFVHFATKTVTPVLHVQSVRGGAALALGEPSSVTVIDGIAVKIADDATYDPDVDNLRSQVLASQAALRARGGI